MVFLLFIVMSVVILIPLLVGVYVYRDARRRGMNAVLWTLIAILAPSLIGFIIYLLVRGNYSNLRCARCDTPVGEQYVVCPKCGAKLRPICPSCSAPVEPDWRVCPKCAQPLPEVQEDIVTPLHPKDKTLWKILLAIILIPVLLLLVLGVGFYSFSFSGGGSSSLREVTFDEYYADQELPESTKAYVREWLETIPGHANQVYALQYAYQFDPENDRWDYYYLLYIPGGGDVGRRGFGFSSGLFSDSFKLDLEDPSNQDGLYCAATTSKKSAPRLKVTLEGKALTADVTKVDFNPTLYTIASEYDYGSLTNASGDLYVEELEKEMKPDLIVISQVKDGQEADTEEFTEPDALLRAVVEIHELQHLEETPALLDEYALSDYYTISIHYSDTTGDVHYEDTSYYWVIEESGAYYLLEHADGGPDADALGFGQLPDSLRVYPLGVKAYQELAALFA